MQIVVLGNKALVCRKIAGIVEKLVEKKPSAVIALPTGSTQLGLYKELVKKYRQGRIDFSKTIFMNLDEYAGLSQSNPQSYACFLRKNFLGKINASEKNIFLFNGKADLKKECLEREKLVKRKGIDLALLGIGQNGHIAFNEPGSSFNSKTRIVNLSPATIKANSRFFKNPEKTPKKAITMGIGTILKAKKIVLIAFGKEKAWAIKKALEKPAGIKVPASALQKHGNAEIYCDSIAAPCKQNK